MQAWLAPISLEDENILLRPLLGSDADALYKAASDGTLWRLWYTTVPSTDTMQDYIQKALEDHQNGLGLAFVVIEKSTQKIIGTTRYMNASATHRRVEIGSTWYSASYQKTHINTACKLLLLTYAFEVLDCIAVEFRTHFHNHASREAILKLGAKQDGILRNHQILPDGSLRDTVVFSIIQSEWKACKNALEFRLNRLKK